MINSKAKVISIVNQKGGVGKTTTATNLSTALAAVGKKTLLLDLDPQGNASTGFGIDDSKRLINIYDILLDENILMKKGILPTMVPKLEIITSTVDLAAAEIELIEVYQREFVLRKRLEQIIYNYEFIIIDCPPSLGILTINALTASHSILVPLQCEFFALEGLSHLLKTIELIKKSLNKNIEIQGIVLTMYDKRNKLTEQIEEDVRMCLSEYLYETVIPRNVRISEAPSHGKPAIVYDTKCPGSIAYMKLAKEILIQESKKVKQQAVLI